jgi:hypothetical protein
MTDVHVKEKIQYDLLSEYGVSSNFIESNE